MCVSPACAFGRLTQLASKLRTLPHLGPTPAQVLVLFDEPFEGGVSLMGMPSEHERRQHEKRCFQCPASELQVCCWACLG